MTSNQLAIRKSLNKAYLKVKPTRIQIETFKEGLISLFNQVKESESEEYHKNIIAEFLKSTYYYPEHYINTKGRTDLVIHNGKDSKSTVGVIIETKRPANKAEMPTKVNLNSKAVHELVLYYLKERISNKNLEIKYLIATNLYEWFIFNAQDFEKVFAKNKKLVADFEKFEAGSLSGTTTDFFYNEIAKPFINAQEVSVPVTWFDLRDYETIVKNDSKEDDKKLIEIYKILSPEHLLKLPFSNDSNTLDKRFYNELLHIIGLEERKEGSKKLIGRKAEGKRDKGSLIENAINILNYEDCLRDIKNLSDYGESKDEQLYQVALELSITWINRILFLKLLEGQLVRYHNSDTSYKFLNAELISDYDTLNKLFFHVLAVKEKERGDHVKEKFRRIPYLNSSLFEPNELEHRTIRISNLEDDYTLPVISGTVLKDNLGKKKIGSLNPLSYLFVFLDAYDFSSEGAEDISEENKTLINASVLGLIFEKINGYKDGSFFTPGFITMYMCRETIRRAVVQKFNDAKGWKCENLDCLYNKIDDLKDANDIINSLKICDPAVGSGHFLVSALNEIIAIKSELKVLIDSSGRRLKNYHVEVINDEIVITDEDGEFFEYHPKNPESQRIQETLFHEKQTIIENCLFGVDINQNSVKICRLRLWIELLKNAYYRPDSDFTELETLPNIDINIKCGNSLISRYPLDADIKNALKKSKWTIDSYRLVVMSYRNAENKEEKASMRKLIDEIKSDFESEVSKSDKRFLRLNKLKGELLSLTGQQNLFEMEGKQKANWEKKVKKTTDEITKLESELEEIRNNKIYENAFEWRFEFPEVLNDDGDFVGFDMVIGNPPYIRIQELNNTENIVEYYSSLYKSGSRGNYDIYVLFIELGLNIVHDIAGKVTYILPHKFINAKYGLNTRNLISNGQFLSKLIHFGSIQIFQDASTYTCLLFLDRLRPLKFEYRKIGENIANWKSDPHERMSEISFMNIQRNDWLLMNNDENNLLRKLNVKAKRLEQVTTRIFQGFKTSADRIFIVKEISRQQNSPIIQIRSPIDGALYTVEKELFHYLIKGGDGKRFYFKESNLLILFPYVDGKIIPSEVMQNKYPKTWDYLSCFKKLLKRREKGKFNNEFWYQYGRNQALDVMSQPKIFTPDISIKPSFAYDQNGSRFFTGGTAGGYGIIVDSIDVYFILGILNSKITQWYISNISTQMRGGWYSFESRFIKNIPIKIPHENKIGKISRMVQNIIDKKDNNPDYDTTQLENDIDEDLYDIYNLTIDEIELIDKSTIN